MPRLRILNRTHNTWATVKKYIVHTDFTYSKDPGVDTFIIIPDWRQIKKLCNDKDCTCQLGEVMSSTPDSSNIRVPVGTIVQRPFSLKDGIDL